MRTMFGGNLFVVREVPSEGNFVNGVLRGAWRLVWVNQGGFWGSRCKPACPMIRVGNASFLLLGET